MIFNPMEKFFDHREKYAVQPERITNFYLASIDFVGTKSEIIIYMIYLLPAETF